MIVELLLGRLLEDVDRQAVRANEQRARIDFVDRVCVAQALGFELCHHLRVVDDVPERRDVVARCDRFFGLLHRDGDAEAEPLDAGLLDLHG